MKSYYYTNQAHVEMRIHTVTNDCVCLNGKGGSSLKVGRQTVFQIQGLPTVFIQTYKNFDYIMNNMKYSLYLCSRKKEVPH